ncbi:MAG: 50S ribosomal protein L21e [Desulfurococcales archaeon]|nr:50S ribosomal protein L21e [Desulfurococcales archaeon]
MVKAPRGYRHRTRKLLRKKVREKGGVPRLSVVLRKYSVGEKVVIKIDPSFHYAMPHRRFHGLTGTVVGTRGRAYIVKVNLGRKEKTLFVTPEHLRPLNG